VYGVNHGLLKASDTVISNASCTTNCLAPLAKVLHEKIGIVHGLMTTIHAYTNDQVLTDVFHKDLRRARSATMSRSRPRPAPPPRWAWCCRNSTASSRLLDARADHQRVGGRPQLRRRARHHEGRDRRGGQGRRRRPLKGILGFNKKPLVSVDFNHDPHSSVYDSTLTKVMGGTLVKVCSWYDNEWGFSNRMLDTTLALMAAK
jgi:glyceraldehyde 3-phosphate dehydrogenase